MVQLVTHTICKLLILDHSILIHQEFGNLWLPGKGKLSTVVNLRRNIRPFPPMVNLHRNIRPSLPTLKHLRHTSKTPQSDTTAFVHREHDRPLRGPRSALCTWPQLAVAPPSRMVIFPVIIRPLPLDPCILIFIGLGPGSLGCPVLARGCSPRSLHLNISLATASCEQARTATRGTDSWGCCHCSTE